MIRVRQTFAREQHSRSERKAGRHPVGLFHDSCGNPESGIADRDRVARMDTQPEQQVVGNSHRVFIKPRRRRIERELAIERITREIRPFDRNKNWRPLAREAIDTVSVTRVVWMPFASSDPRKCSSAADGSIGIRNDISAAIKARASRNSVYRTDSLNPVTAVNAAAPRATERTTKRNFPVAARVSRQAMRNGKTRRLRASCASSVPFPLTRFSRRAI